jgi:hypothetical protein
LTDQYRGEQPLADQDFVGGAGRLMRTFWSVATTRHPAQFSICSVRNSPVTRSSNALRPVRQTNEQKTGVGPRGVAAHVREIQILRDEKTPRGLCCGPDLWISTTGQLLSVSRIHVVTERREDIDQAVRQVSSSLILTV